MPAHTARVSWAHGSGEFLKGKYSRVHHWTFDGGVVVPASPALSSVPLPYSNASCVDPEEAYVASISSCHMLTFLYIGFKAGVEVLSYEDNAVGTVVKNEYGVEWMKVVELHPKIVYGPNRPTAGQVAQLHHEAHEQCYIANSVKTEIRLLPPA